jgi:hypothetical protein
MTIMPLSGIFHLILLNLLLIVFRSAVDPTALVLSSLTGANSNLKEPSFVPPTLNSAAGQKPGDTIISTQDGAAFHVHFDILAFTSPVFCTLLTPCLSPNTFTIDEISAVFVCFTGLAYSRDVPRLTTFHALDNALHVATKYELTIMKRLLRGILSDPTSPLFLEKDPISAFGIALNHDFPKELAAASRLVIQRVDFRDPQTLQLLKSSTTGSRIMNMLALRQSKLADALFSMDRGLVLVNDLNVLRLLTCQSCFVSAEARGIKLVQWTTHWAQNAYEILSSSCVTVQHRLFGVGYILEMMSSPMSCVACRGAIAENPQMYEMWMQSIKDKLAQRLVTDLEA